MPYCCDLSEISLYKFKSNLLSQKLLPSQKIMLDEIDKKFAAIKLQGINDLKALYDAIKDKAKAKQFSKATSLDEKYLAVLKREISAYQPKPIKIADFTLISDGIKDILNVMGIKTTAHLFDNVDTPAARKKFACDSGITEEEALLMAKLCDVSRLRYVNAAFSELLVRSKYDTVEKIKRADYMKLYEELKALNEGNRYYTGHIGPKDMDYLVRDKANSDIVMEL